MRNPGRLIGWLLCWTSFLPVEAAQPVVLIFDNDVHCAVEGYARMAALKDSLQQIHPHVVALSCGDFLTGNVKGALSKGTWPVQLMQAVPYDWITLGNHEFDFGIRQMRELLAPLSDRVVCCNFLTLPDSLPVYNAYTLQNYGGRTIAFIGVTTPSVPIHTSPAYFDHYTFGENNCAAIVQRCVDEVRRQGAQTVIVLSHLGDHSDPVLTSRQLIARTHGIDVVLDGHDHSILLATRLRNSRGKSVLLVSTGCAFRYIGQVELSKGRRPRARLIDPLSVRCRNLRTDSLLSDIQEHMDLLDQTPVGNNPYPNLSLDIRDPMSVRRQETPLGDFCADALRRGTGADIGLINGGAIRAGLPEGEIHLSQLYDLFPFGNTVSVVETTGKTLLDELNTGICQLPQPSGGFLQVSGLTLEVVMQPHPHVTNVQVWNARQGTYQPIDPDQTYTVATIDYLLKKGGNGHVFQTCRMLQESRWSDVELLEKYLQALPNQDHGDYPTLGGRILIR